MSPAEHSKILASIALVLMAGYYVFKIPLLLHGVFVLLFLVAFPCRLSRFLASSWIRFSEALGRVNSIIILTVIYFLVLTPISFCYRRFNQKIIKYFEGDVTDSLFLDSTMTIIREMFEKTW